MTEIQRSHNQLTRVYNNSSGSYIFIEISWLFSVYDIIKTL